MKTNKFINGLVEKANEEENLYRIIASTSSIDRQGDSVDQSGWDLTHFKKNPVLIWGHDYKALPIGKVTHIEVIKGELVAKFKFASAEANPIAAQVQKLYEEGIVNASSVGFIPLERNGHVITKAQLLELSLVPVPANQDALRLAFATKSFDLIEKDFKVIEKCDTENDEYAEDIEKGEIEEEMTAESIYTMKWQKMELIQDIISAFFGVYFDENTPVKDFNKLVLEMTELFNKVANDEDVASKAGDVDNKVLGFIEKDLIDSCRKDYINAILEKAGKRLSKKTVNVIDNSIVSMQELIKVLENLKQEDDQAETQAEGETDESIEKTEPDLKEVFVPFKVFLQSVQDQIRTGDKSLENANKLLNNFLNTRN